MLSAFVKPRSGGFTKGSYQRAVASGFFIVLAASVLHTLAMHSVLVAWKKRDTANDPGGVAFRSDHKNEQLDRLSAFGPRYGRSTMEYGVQRVADLFLIGVNKHG